MQRTINLFACSSVVLLVAGLVLARYGSNVELGVPWPGSHTHAGIPLQTLCYAIASLFGGFACLYAFGYIPFSGALAPWHFWLSAVGVVFFAVGFLMICLGGMTTGITGVEPAQWVLRLALVGFVGGPLCFVGGQTLFLVNIVSAVPRMFHP